MMLGAAALTAMPMEATMAPTIVAALQPYRFVRELAIGPQPNVTPTRIEGMKETEPRPLLKTLISSTTNKPNE